MTNNHNVFYLINHGIEQSSEVNKLKELGLLGNCPEEFRLPSGHIFRADNGIRMEYTANGRPGRVSKQLLDLWEEAGDKGFLKHRGKKTSRHARRELLRHVWKRLARIIRYEIALYLPIEEGERLLSELLFRVNIGVIEGHSEGIPGSETLYLAGYLGPGHIDHHKAVKITVYRAREHDIYPGMIKIEIAFRKNFFRSHKIRPYHLSTFAKDLPIFMPDLVKHIDSVFAKAPRSAKAILSAAGVNSVEHLLQKASIRAPF